MRKVPHPITTHKTHLHLNLMVLMEVTKKEEMRAMAKMTTVTTRRRRRRTLHLHAPRYTL